MKNICFIIFTIAIAGLVQGQVRIAGSAANASTQTTSAFLDASSNTNYHYSSDFGKGMIFPRTNLATFMELQGGTEPATGRTQFLTLYDGFLVYNSSDGGVAGTDALGTKTQGGRLTPGWWYYENPEITETGGRRTLYSGTWKRLGGSVTINNSESNQTNITIDGESVYTYKNQFEVLPNQTKYTLTLPTDGIGTLYKITIYNKDLGVFVNTVYSFDTASGEVVTGYPNMSVVYQPGTYNYVLEYLKP